MSNTINSYLNTYFNTYNLLYHDHNIHNFNLIQDYPQITTPDAKQSLYKYLKHLIIQNINNITQKQHNNIIKILKDNEYDFTNIINTINFDNFYHIDDILDIIFPNKDYINNQQYKNLKEISDAKLPTQSIQHHTNKLFQQVINNKNIYYYYFSYGTLKHIKLIIWQDALRIYVEEINKLLNDELTEHIILAGHSVGSIVIQHLGIELIKNNIDTHKIYIIGSGCRMANILTDNELYIFRQNFTNRYCFIISAYEENDKIHYDHRNNDKELNKINTHLLICDNKMINDYDNYKSISYDIIDHDDIDKSDIYMPDPNIILHEFITYSKLYLNRLND
jgi:hypothetical protein